MKLSWGEGKALPPVTDGYPNGEVGSTVVLGGKWYMLFGGGHIYSSDNPIQGYKPDAKNWAFHTDGDGVRGPGLQFGAPAAALTTRLLMASHVCVPDHAGRFLAALECAGRE